MGRFIVPLIWFGIAVGIYVYNQGDQGKIVMWGMNFLVGDDPTARGNATVALAVFLGLVTSVGPVTSLLAKKGSADADD